MGERLDVSLERAIWRGMWDGGGIDFSEGGGRLGIVLDPGRASLRR